MKRQEISYDDYKKEVLRIYRDMRREVYYYPLITIFLEGCISDEEKLIPVHENKGYSDSGTGMHNRTKYADKNNLQDMIIVSSEYTYEHTTSPYVSVEIKMPSISFNEEEILKYTPLEIVKQLNEQFRYCKYIIFTDCITWYFLKKGQGYEDKICLLDKLKWKQDNEIWDKLKSKVTEMINNSKTDV